MKFIETIPAQLFDLKKGVSAVEGCFVAGPGFVAGMKNRFDPPISIEAALEWLEHYRTPMRAGHILLEDGTLLFFDPLRGFTNTRVLGEGEKTPGPGVTVETAD